ncbi:MAG: outer membrane beta-barrel protein [Burkholderiales bacterium]|nr:outer membrane beta-barrel protein [Burkholderiales bacterium]
MHHPQKILLLLGASLVPLFSSASTTTTPTELVAEISSPAYINVNTGWASIHNLPTGSWAGSLNAGYNVNSYFALEGGYNILASSQFGATATSNIFDVAAKGALPLSDVFSLYGRAGIGYGIDGWSGTATGSPSWLCAGQYNSNYATALVGLGGSFALSKHFDLRVEDYAFIPFSNTMNGGINIVTFGTQYNF